jgi:hypothetical protein
MRTMSIRYDVYVDNSTESETKVANKLHNYANKKVNRGRRINEKGR